MPGADGEHTVFKRSSLPWLLVVAGPGGGGKSKFIDLLTSKQLPRVLSDKLPDGCDAWPMIEANVFLKRSVDPESRLSPLSGEDGLILHYDISYIRRLGLNRYQLDPLHGVLNGAKRLTFVSICPPRDVLIRQLVGRRQERERAKGWLRSSALHFTRRILNTGPRRVNGLELGEALDLYADEQWLRSCYLDWDAFVRQWVETSAGASWLRIEPSTSAADGGPFRLAAFHP